MAKGQKRSGREPKKPKKEKPKVIATSSPFAAARAKEAESSGPKKCLEGNGVIKVESRLR